MVTIDNKFNIGEEVFSIWEAPLKYECNMCDSTGVIEIKQMEVTCPKCRGTKTVISDTYKYWEVVEDKLKVQSIKASINNTGVSIRYKVGALNRGEQNIFKTMEEAQTKCDELNCDWIKSLND